FKQKTAYEISRDWSSDVCSSDLLDLGEDRAFLIAVAVFPKHFPHPQAIRHFLDSYRTLHHEAALERVKLWRADRASQVIVEQRRVGANTDRRQDQGTVLKAS